MLSLRKINDQHILTNKPPKFFISQNLAFADEFFLIGLPILIYTMHLGEWIFGVYLCKLYMISTSITQFTSSIFLVIMSADRYDKQFSVFHSSHRNGEIEFSSNEIADLLPSVIPSILRAFELHWYQKSLALLRGAYQLF